MAITEQLRLYCERGQSGALWAEPFNAVSNLAFFLAAAAAARLWWQRPASERGGVEAGLIVLVALIGLGSTLFHTFATRWGMVADVVPIGTFVVIYAGYAMRRFLALSWITTGLGLAVLAAAAAGASAIPCPAFAVGADNFCLNGSTSYLPALFAMVAIGAAALRTNRPAGRILLGAAAVFSVSLVLRTLDRDLCEVTRLFGAPRGTHALWHLLNAATLALLLRAALLNGGGGNDRERNSPIA